jgi:GT2 family glycosyltransferase
MIDLAVIVLNFRTAELTCGCLETLAGEIEPGVEVVVVDNASDDGSAAAIERVVAARSWRWARVLRSPVNGGFAAGNNLGIRSVDARAYVLLNSDTLVRPGALRALRDALRTHPRAGVVGAGTLTSAGARDPSSFRFIVPATELLRAANTGPLTRLLARFHPGLPESGRAEEVDWVGFACVAIRRELIEEIGLLDEGYFMYFEDVDYCRRARQAGWTVLHWPEAKIVHLLGGTSGVTDEARRRRRAPRYYYEARARYFGKFHGRAGLWLANALWWAGRLVSLAREALGRAPVHREREALDIWIGAADPLASRRGEPR